MPERGARGTGRSCQVWGSPSGRRCQEDVGRDAAAAPPHGRRRPFGCTLRNCQHPRAGSDVVDTGFAHRWKPPVQARGTVDPLVRTSTLPEVGRCSSDGASTAAGAVITLRTHMMPKRPVQLRASSGPPATWRSCAPVSPRPRHPNRRRPGSTGGGDPHVPPRRSRAGPPVRIPHVDPRPAVPTSSPSAIRAWQLALLIHRHRLRELQVDELHSRAVTITGTADTLASAIAPPHRVCRGASLLLGRPT